MAKNIVTEKNHDGLFLSDLIKLAQDHNVNPKDLYLTLCIEGVETGESRIGSATVDVDMQTGLTPPRKTGVLWLGLTHPIAQAVDKAFN